jgi:hypothetical protein
VNGLECCEGLVQKDVLDRRAMEGLFSGLENGAGLAVSR